MPFRPSTAVLAACCAFAAAGALAQSRADSPEARYQQERARCLSGQTHQAREVCLQEAGAALEDARRGRLGAGDERQWQANALLRCQRQPASERELCERMARGEGTQSGSVESGGIVRELRVTVPGDAGAGAAAPAAQPGSTGAAGSPPPSGQ